MTKIKISHTVDIDKCIADEISELNNKHNILTIYSCCGHITGKAGMIVVHEFLDEKIKKLGYKPNGIYHPCKGLGNQYTTYATKTVCPGACSNMKRMRIEKK